MRHSDFVDSMVQFNNWNQKISALASGDRKWPSRLSALLPSSPGALVVKRCSKQTTNSSLNLLQHDLERRLKFNWIVSKKPIARTVAIVGGRPMYDEIQDMYGSRGFFEAAQALGISLTVLDEPNHWLKKEKYSHLRQEFIPVDMSNITDLPRRMADALKDKHVDGIVTFTDGFVIATAEAAEILKLPTEPLSSMKKAHYKHEMRRLVNKTNIQAMHMTSVDQLEDVKLQQSFQSLKYPLIVKPSRGQFSRGVKKVGSDAAMRQAVRELDKEGLMEQGVLIETYVDGPELDANFVLWNGQVLFLEVTDNLPCPGDKSAATSDESFVETVQISNSGLPANELNIIRNSLHDSLLQLGFRSGVFHVEARMQNSSMQYQDLRGDNILDLAPVSRSREQDPDVFLIEVNARSPGTGGTWATLYTYGVDMGALQLLHAVGDAERFASLSQPFSSTLGRDHVDIGGGGGAQYWGAHCMIPVHRDHVFVPPGFIDMVLAEIPHISAHVSRAELYAEAGTFVSPGDSAWVAYFLLFSKVDRRHLLEMYHLVAQVSRRILDEHMEDREDIILSV
ncbi:carnosine synthase 1 [Fusarium phyllophilum]|uniref:Carnosine synthase 1 n=1 Tax=Fusarium phyllophilum TaxID=47803 RepID=A0A8H5N4B3_9HYPO|nr:carnosine synthase 1 [Fusarium phyllophilum]